MAPALRALTIRQAAPTPGGVKVYDELGISRFLPEGTRQREAELFVRHWVGPVVDYDAERGTELVTTLSTYLDHGGDLIAAAAELSIHRSTLRYRLHLIAELTIRTPTGNDITDLRVWGPQGVGATPSCTPVKTGELRSSSLQNSW